MLHLLTYISFIWTLKFWFTAFAVLILRSIIRMYLLRQRMPPGPFPLPFVGNFPTIMTSKLLHMYEIFMEFQKRYGDPVTVFFANTPCIILSKYEISKDVFQQITCSDRQDSPVFEYLFDGAANMTFGPFDHTRQISRKIFSKSARVLIDVEKLEEQALLATNKTIQGMLQVKHQVEPKNYLRNLIYNIILGFAFGKTYEMDDPDFISLIEADDLGTRNITKAAAIDFIPFARYLPLHLIPVVKKSKELMKVFTDYAMTQMVEHRKTYQPGVIRDFCDAMLREEEFHAVDGSDQLTDIDFAMIVVAFYGAGTGTNISTITWFVLLMATHPEIQEECYRAIKEAIGDQQPHLRDRNKLAIIEACILETLRLRPPTPLGLPRASQTDTKIGPYFIPKGTMTLANIYAMQTDPDEWKDPLKFDPRGHFMDAAGQIQKPSSFMPFGSGRRVCLGEQLGKNILFLAATRLLQQVKWSCVPGVEYTIDPDPESQFATMARPFPILMEKRK